VRQAATGHLVLGMESTRNRMTRLGKNEVTGGEILSADEIMERYDAVTIDDLKRVSSDVLSAEKVLAVIGPFTEENLERLVQ
jgi:predicted Zn-dependent peptidase